jgi:hypothetical protein
VGRNPHNFNAVNKLLSSALYDLKRIEDLISLPVQHGSVWDEVSARAEVIVAAAPAGQARDRSAFTAASAPQLIHQDLGLSKKSLGSRRNTFRACARSFATHSPLGLPLAPFM